MFEIIIIPNLATHTKKILESEIEKSNDYINITIQSKDLKQHLCSRDYFRRKIAVTRVAQSVSNEHTLCVLFSVNAVH